MDPRKKRQGDPSVADEPERVYMTFDAVRGYVWGTGHKHCGELPYWNTYPRKEKASWRLKNDDDEAD